MRTSHHRTLCSHSNGRNGSIVVTLRSVCLHHQRYANFFGKHFIIFNYQSYPFFEHTDITVVERPEFKTKIRITKKANNRQNYEHNTVRNECLFGLASLPPTRSLLSLFSQLSYLKPFICFLSIPNFVLQFNFASGSGCAGFVDLCAIYLTQSIQLGSDWLKQNAFIQIFQSNRCRSHSRPKDYHFFSFCCLPPVKIINGFEFNLNLVSIHLSFCDLNFLLFPFIHTNFH